MKAATLMNASRFFQISWFALVLIALLALSGCGGGSSSSSPATPIPGVSAGEITGFGSIIVNGVRFHTGGAELSFGDGSAPVTLDDNPSNNQLHLSKGMEVEVEGTFDGNGTGTATRVIVDSTLTGPIQNLSPAGDVRTFTILGQNVVTARGMTLVDNRVLLSNLDNLANDMVIEVHGLPDGSGNVQASFIESSTATIFELTGLVASRDVNGTDTFMIGSQLVDFSGALVRDGDPSNGALVEVKGNLDPGGTFVATDVELKGDFGDQAKIEVEGLITALDTNAETFMLRGQPISFANARFMGGVEADLLNGLKVEAEGPISGGTLLAVKIKFKDNFRYEGEATQLGNELVITNPGGLDLSITIDTNMTRNDSTAGPGLGQFKVRARQLSGPNLLATRVKDDSGGNTTRQIFQAPVVRIAGPMVEILDDGNGAGVIVIDTSTISTDNSGSSNFEIEDNDVGSTAFFAALQVGDIVKARWDGSWEQIEIELDD